MIGLARRLGAFIFSSVACCLATAGFAASTPAGYDINVRIDPAARELSGAALIIVGIALLATSSRLAEKFTDDFEE